MEIIGEDKFVIARKSHTCTLCGKVIDKGVSYRSYTVLEYGDFHHCKEHRLCHHIATECELYDEGYIDMDYHLEQYKLEEKEAQDEQG